MSIRNVVVLAGGLGGSRCVDALAQAADPDSVTVIGNVGDDLDFLGLHVSPDLDTVLYTLAGLLDEERGWGVRDETYNALETAKALGEETWFTLGDRDIGLHLVRTRLLRDGRPLSEVTRHLCRCLGVRVRLMPVSDDPIRTQIGTSVGALDFQTWFVKHRHQDEVVSVWYEGAERARPAVGVLEAIRDAELVVIAPSNPFVSIGPILAVPGIQGALASRRERVVAISPLVGGKAIKGPLVEMMESMGPQPNAAGVAAMYEGVASRFVIDPADAELAQDIPGAVVCPIVMVEPERRAEVGRKLLEALA